MATTGTRVTVSTTATLIYTATGQTKVILRISAGGPIDLGDSSVTSGSGFYFDNSVTALYIELSDNETLYGIVGSGTATITVLAIN